MSIEHKPSKLVVKVLVLAINAFMKTRSKIVIEQNDTLKMKGPYIILSNHVNNWDPLLINSYVNDPICFVAGDSLFRNPILKRLLDYTGAIPKTKFKKDTNTIRGLLKAKKSNRVMAIFPEGNRNWDGCTEPIIYTTAKLVKSLNIPVVVATIKGGHLTHPRWADRPRKGVISLSLKKLWDQGDVAKETPDSINEMLTKALAHDELDWQQSKQIPYKGKNLAQYLERFLFVCPHCEQPAQMRSDGDLLKCHHCEYTVRYTEFGVFKEVTHSVKFSTPRDWNRWQLQFMKETLLTSKDKWQNACKDHVKFLVSKDNHPFQEVGYGILSLDKSDIVFTSDLGDVYRYNIKKLEGLNVQFNSKLDFHIDEQLYRMEFYQPHTSAYKWVQAVKFYRE